MEKEERQYVLESSTKALITFIPLIGGAIGPLLSDALADRKEQRINEFLRKLKEDLDKNKELVNSHFLNKDDFLDIFESTAKKIANERSELKREAFKNILVHGILSGTYTYDEVENQMRILDLLSADHIILLKLLNHPKSFNATNIDITKIRSSTYLGLFRQIFPNWDKDYLFDYMRDLENNRLIEDITNNFQTMMTNVIADNLEGKLTSRGATFISFILQNK